jgi:outer membrane protein OmpU
MKKVLLASVALVGFAGYAAAEVSFSGNGRVGVVFEDDGTTDDTFVSYRLRFNIDASKETDSGITFGGRIRLQYDSGDNTNQEDGGGGDVFGEAGAELNAAMIYMEASGIRVEVGNSNSAFDSLNTLYNAELGFIGTTLGSYSLFDYASYSSGPWSGETQADRVGLFASYSVGDLVARISYIDPNQFDDGDEAEVGVSFDYSTGPFSVGLGYVSNANFTPDYDVYALLGEYALNDTTNVGLQIIGEDGGDNDLTYTLYGNTTLAGGIGLGGFISGVDSDFAYENDFAIGLGASYDIGGATLAGTIQQGFDEETYADFGVSFSF